MRNLLMTENAADNKTIEFTDFSDKKHSPGDVSSAEVQKALAERVQQLRDELAMQEQAARDVTEAMAAASSQEEKSRLMAEYRSQVNKKSVCAHKLGQIEQHVAAFQKNSSLYTNLMNMKENLSANPDINSRISVDKDDLSLVVEMMKPSPFSFEVRDGRLTFSNVDVTQDQLKSMLDTLEHLGIKNVVLPDGLDARLKENMEKAQTAREAEENRNYNPDAARQGELNAGPAMPDVFGATPMNMPAPKPEPEYKYDYDELVHKIEFDSLQRNFHKTKGLSFFHDTSGGWDKWYVYDTQNPDNFKNDGKLDKDGSIKTKNSLVIWSRPDGNGGFKLGYTMPGHKPISKGYADELISFYKSAGITAIKFSGLQGEDAATFRVRCARLGVIPVGIGINEKNAAEMIEEAGKKLNSQELLKYKLRLARQMRKNLRDKGDDINSDSNSDYKTFVEGLEGDYNYSPFKKAYDKVLKGQIDDAIHGKQADKVIGATSALTKLFDAYSGSEDNPTRATLGFALNEQNKIFTKEEIAAIRQQLSTNGRAIDESKPMRDMSVQDLAEIYNAILPIEQEKARKNLMEDTQGQNSKDKSEVIRDSLSSATDDMVRFAQTLEDKGCKKPVITRFGTRMKISGDTRPVQGNQNINGNFNSGGRD